MNHMEREAADNGNPYPWNTDQWQAWNEGYSQAIASMSGRLQAALRVPQPRQSDAVAALPPARSGKIAIEEVIELFGDTMPIEVGNLLFNPPDVLNVNDIRSRMREIAAAIRQPERGTM